MAHTRAYINRHGQCRVAAFVRDQRGASCSHFAELTRCRRVNARGRVTLVRRRRTSWIKDYGYFFVRVHRCTAENERLRRAFLSPFDGQQARMISMYKRNLLQIRCLNTRTYTAHRNYLSRTFTKRLDNKRRRVAREAARRPIIFNSVFDGIRAAIGYLFQRFPSLLLEISFASPRILPARHDCIMHRAVAVRRQCKFSPTGTIILISRSRNFALPRDKHPGARTWRQYAPFVLSAILRT